MLDASQIVTLLSIKVARHIVAVYAEVATISTFMTSSVAQQTSCQGPETAIDWLLIF